MPQVEMPTQPPYDEVGIADWDVGHSIPGRDKGDWTDEELAVAARGNSTEWETDDSGDRKIKHSSGVYGKTQDGRKWDLATYTIRCNDEREVKISPPWLGSYEYVEAVPLHHQYTWTPNPSRHLYAIPGLNPDRPMIVVVKYMTQGAGTRGCRLTYVGPYLGDIQSNPNDDGLFPVEMGATGE